jgi:hypothetical protein
MAVSLNDEALNNEDMATIDAPESRTLIEIKRATGFNDAERILASAHARLL